MTFVSNLEPQPLWRHFDRILTIPRGSKNEAAMRRYVFEVAGAQGLETAADAAGNVVVRKPARPGREGAAVTVLQAHLDMVNEKNAGLAHDFSRDAIRPRRDGDYLAAEGTTLGSDNGIGVAAMLAVAQDREIAHGALELLFTVDEETGLSGASDLDPGLLAGRRLLNLDSEEEGALYVGCAGGGDSRLTLPLARAAVPAGVRALRVRFSGLAGGHSGVDIHLQRGNAIKLLARGLHTAGRGRALRLAALAGGSAHNAIPREAEALALVPAAHAADFARELEREAAAMREELRRADPGLVLAVEPAAVPDQAWDEASTACALRMLCALHHGVLAMSADIPDLVETSTNVARVEETGDGLLVGVSSRSSVASALRAHRQRVRAIAELAGAAVTEAKGYPGWKPDLTSPLLAILQRVHQREIGAAPRIRAIHAGLECGIIGEKFPGMDMISFGPQIEFPHSPSERVHVASVARFWRLLGATLGELAG